MNKTETLAAAATVLRTSQSESAKTNLRKIDTFEIAADAVPCCSAHSAVATPFEFRHLTIDHIHLERSTTPNLWVLFSCHSVMPWRQRQLKASSIVGHELGSRLS